jgi:hypothetical protein
MGSRLAVYCVDVDTLEKARELRALAVERFQLSGDVGDQIAGHRVSIFGKGFIDDGRRLLCSGLLERVGVLRARNAISLGSSRSYRNEFDGFWSHVGDGRRG